MKRVVTLAALFALGLPAGAASLAPPPEIVFDIVVRWTPDQIPDEVWLQVDGNRIDLDKQSARFVKAVPGGRQLLGRKAFLHARYPNGETALPVRLLPGEPNLALTVHRRAGPTTCDFATVRRLIQPASNYLEQIVQYFDAKRLAREWPSTCHQANKKDVIEAWYRNSYQLGGTPHIEYDDEAKRAWDEARIPRRLPRAAQRHGLTDMFEIEQFETSARMTELNYDYQLQLIRAGELEEALAVNEAITETLNQDATLATAAAQAQGVTRGRLGADRAYIETLISESER